MRGNERKHLFAAVSVIVTRGFFISSFSLGVIPSLSRNPSKTRLLRTDEIGRKGEGEKQNANKIKLNCSLACFSSSKVYSLYPPPFQTVYRTEFAARFIRKFFLVLTRLSEKRVQKECSTVFAAHHFSLLSTAFPLLLLLLLLSFFYPHTYLDFKGGAALQRRVSY